MQALATKRSVPATGSTIKLENTLSLDKDYWFNGELRPGYLYVYIRSRLIDYDRARKYWNEIGVMLERTHCDRLLIDKDIAAELTIPDAYRIASEVASEMKGVKIAMCDRNATAETAEFGESVVRNRGLHARTFSDLHAAQEWLLAKDDFQPVTHFPHLALVSRSGLGLL